MAKKPTTQPPVLSNPEDAPALASQTPKAELPFPIIKFAANNSVLYPLDAKDGTEAKLTLPARATSVMFYMEIKDQDEPVFEPVAVEDGVDVVAISAKTISRCIKHTVLFYYTAIVGGKAQSSLTLELEVQQLEEKDLVVSRPVFVHSRNEWNTWWLRMKNFSGNETVEITAWPMIYEGQRLFLTVAGNQHVEPYRFIWVAFDHVVQAHEARAGYVFKFSLSRAWLSRLDDYSAVTCHVGIIWDATPPRLPTPDVPHLENPLPINAQDLHLRTTSLLEVDTYQELPPPNLREAVELPPGHWQVNPVNTVKGAHAIVSYDMVAGDNVCAYASGLQGVRIPLGCQVVKEGDSSLSFDVDPGIIAALFNKTLKLEYSVQLANHAPQFAPERVIKVLGPQINRPEIEEATGNVVCLKTFAGDATGLVPSFDYGPWAKCCWMWVTGTDKHAKPHRFDVLVKEPFRADWVQNGVETPILRSELKKLADCRSFDLHFAVSFDDQCELTTAIDAPAQQYTLELESLVLLAPSVTEAMGNQLTAYNGREGVHVEVVYPDIDPGHEISVCWKLPQSCKPSYCWPLEPKPGSTGEVVQFFLPREAVIHSMGKTVEITYTVTTACKVQTSAPLNLEISLPRRLPTPVVLEATPPATQNGILDLSNFSGDAHITVKDEKYGKAWWWALKDQRAWLRGVGMLQNGGVHIINVHVAKAVTADEVNNGLVGILLRSEMEKLKHQSQLKIKLSATTDCSAHESDAVPFPTLELTVKSAPEIRYENFTGQKEDIISVGGVITIPTMTITHFSGPGRSGVNNYFSYSDPYISGMALALVYNVVDVPEPQVLKLELTFICSHIEFGVGALNHTLNVSFFDEYGSKVGQVNVKGRDELGGFLNQWVKYSAPQDRRIARIDLTSSDSVYVDNFTFFP